MHTQEVYSHRQITEHDCYLGQIFKHEDALLASNTSIYMHGITDVKRVISIILSYCIPHTM